MINFLVQNIHLVYTAISLITSTYLYQASKKFSGSTLKKATKTHALVSLWSGIIYLNFSAKIIPADLTYFADWVISTPLLAYAFLTTHKINKDNLLTTVFLQSIVIQLGALAYMTQNLTWFGIGTLTLIPVLYKIAETTYKKDPYLTTIFIGTWIAYPIIFLQYSADLTKATIPLTILPLISKHVFAIIHTAKLRKN